MAKFWEILVKQDKVKIALIQMKYFIKMLEAVIWSCSVEKVISCKFCEISKNTFFYRIPLVSASEMPRIKYNFNQKVDFEYHPILWRSYEETLQEKMRLSIKDFFSKCDQSRSFMRIWSHLIKKSWMENLIFCAVRCREKDPWDFITILKNL